MDKTNILLTTPECIYMKLKCGLTMFNPHSYYQ